MLNIDQLKHTYASPFINLMDSLIDSNPFGKGLKYYYIKNSREVIINISAFIEVNYRGFGLSFNYNTEYLMKYLKFDVSYFNDYLIDMMWRRFKVKIEETRKLC